jgi:hypothetical protein
VGAGKVSLGLELVICSGAETGGGTICTGLFPGTRIDDKSRCSAGGVGGTIPATSDGAG